MANKTSDAQLKAIRTYQNNNERIEVVFPKGTKDRIIKLGYKHSTFIKEVVLNELDKLEKLNNK